MRLPSLNSPVVNITTLIYYIKVRVFHNCIIISSKSVKQHLIFEVMVINNCQRKKKKKERSWMIEESLKIKSY